MVHEMPLSLYMRIHKNQFSRSLFHHHNLLLFNNVTFNNRSSSLSSISSAFPNGPLQIRTIVHAHYAPIAPRPPPREYEPDGTLRRYKTNATFYDHGISWIRWHFKAVGVFHIAYEGECSEELGPRAAYREQFRWWAQFIPICTVGFALSALVMSVNTIGICPQIYTEDWIEASRERDRAENSYPFTRYLDRRRKERGSHWIVARVGPNSPNWIWQSGQRDTAYLRAKAIRARKLWLDQETRRQQLEEEDKALEEQLEDSTDEDAATLRESEELSLENETDD